MNAQSNQTGESKPTGTPELPISFEEALEAMRGLRGDEWVEQHMGLLESQWAWMAHMGFVD